MTVDRERFDKAMRAAGFLTQKALCDHIHLQQPKLSNVLNGNRRPRVEELPSMARALGFSMDELFQVLDLEALK